jgi:hypothetical protein
VINRIYAAHDAGIADLALRGLEELLAK